MAKANSSFGSARTADTLCAATGWNRYQSMGYLCFWYESTRLAGISTTDMQGILNSFPDQLAAHLVSPYRILETLLRTGDIQQNGERYTIVSNVTKKELMALRKSSCPGHWPAYAIDFERRHGVAPARDRQSNVALKQIEETVPCDWMDRFLRFFVAHNDPKYTGSYHDLSMAVLHRRSLFTQLRKGQPLMSGKVRSDAKRDETQDQFKRILRGEVR